MINATSTNAEWQKRKKTTHTPPLPLESLRVFRVDVEKAPTTSDTARERERGRLKKETWCVCVFFPHFQDVPPAGTGPSAAAAVAAGGRLSSSSLSSLSAEVLTGQIEGS